MNENIDLSNINHLLHVLRNPYGWNDHVKEAVRLKAADELERLARGNDQTKPPTVSVGLNGGLYMMHRYIEQSQQGLRFDIMTPGNRRICIAHSKEDAEKIVTALDAAELRRAEQGDKK